MNDACVKSVSAQANVSVANVKPHGGGRSQNRSHTKALMEYLLLGRVED
jgi:hypothetical protein